MLIGIDLNSRKLAACLWDEKTYYTSEAYRGITDRPAICAMLYEAACELVKPGDRVFIEEPVLAGVRNIQSTIKCAAAYGAVLAALHLSHAVVTPLPVATWKLATIGKGNASKVDVSNWLDAQHPLSYRECGGDQDLVDATCIALSGKLLLEKEARERLLYDQASNTKDS